MNEENNENVIDPVETNYLEQIADLKLKLDQAVDQTKYDDLVKEHKKLTDEFINRRQPVKPEKPKLRPVAEINKDLRSFDNDSVTNRKFLETSLEYRNAYLAETGKDPFTQNSDAPTADSQRVADGIQFLLDEFPNDNDFNYQFSQMVSDAPALDSIMRNRRRK